jgi:hypothetical protein
MDNKVLRQPHNINETGWEYHNKMRGETKKSAFVSGPLLLLFFTLCTALIVGWNIYTWYILIFPFALVTLFTYFIPLVIRGKYINAMATSLQVKENSVVVETFDWFFLEPKHLQINGYNVTIKENSGDIQDFPANGKLSLSKDGKTFHVYLIRDFFDDWEEIMQQLKSLNNLTA